MLVLQPRTVAFGSLFWHLPGRVASILLPGSSRSNLDFVRVGRLSIDDLYVNPKYVEDKGLVIPESFKAPKDRTGEAAARDSNVEAFQESKMIQVEPPSSEPYQLHGSTTDMHRSQFKQDYKLEPLLTQIKDGFFVESGAHDGESISNTLYYESIGWQGLLIEPGNDYGRLRQKNRKAWSFHGALSPTGRSEMVNFRVDRHVLGQIVKSNAKGNVQAEPLAKILAAISPTRTTVDFWSLDIEGAECDVLQTTDFEKITVGILLIEVNKVGVCVSKVMKERGFVRVGRLSIDDLYVNPKYVEDKGLVIPESFKAPKDRTAEAAARDSNVEAFQESKMIQVEPPSSEPYQLHGSTADMHRSQFKQDYKLEPLLTQIKDGFFVESGAHDGESISNTLYYESIGWQGLLIEPGNDYGRLRQKNRKAWSFHGALSPTGRSEMVNFQVDRHVLGQIVKSNAKGNVQAEPLAKILAAISPTRTTVDFWSLDIEGAECDVLQTTDFEKITVGILLIEVNKVGVCVSKVMKERGFVRVGRLSIDDLYVNPKYVEDKGLVIPESFKAPKDRTAEAAARDSNVEAFQESKMIQVEPPSSEPYQLHGSTADMHRSQFKQDYKLEPLLTQIKDGFFVESGAHDGEAISNTLYYESIGWQGLLIEPGNKYDSLRQKNRKAWLFHGALSPTGRSEMVNFQVDRHVLGQIVKSNAKGNVQAEPLAKLLAAISPTRTTVDFWSLDIEGAECDVLQTTDFEKITVGILLIEVNKVGVCVSKVMREKGFVRVGRLSIDDLYVNPKYVEDKGLVIPESFKAPKDRTGEAAARDSNVEAFQESKMIQVEPPSSEPYQLHGSTADMHRSQFKQDYKLEPLLTQIKDGFFVESGAHDGEAISNTLYYESIGWQGLLIEPGNKYDSLRQKNRKAWLFHGALSPTGRSEMVNFQVDRHVLGQIVKSNAKGNVQAEPLAKLLAAISPTRTTVDFWSLDIEGAECDVLQTTDFEKITVGILLIEVNKVGVCVSKVMKERGFVRVGRLSIDDLYVNPKYVEDKGIVIPESLKGAK